MKFKLGYNKQKINSIANVKIQNRSAFSFFSSSFDVT